MNLIFFLQWPLVLAIVFLSTCSNGQLIENSTKIYSDSIYEQVFLLKSQFDKLTKLVSSEYNRLIQNDTSNLATFKAFSGILQQFNGAFLDLTLESIANGNGPLNNVSLECELSLGKYQMGLVEQKPWAYKILDANGWVTSGVLEGTYTNFGDFDECLTAIDDETGLNMRGQYCLLKYSMEFESNQTDFIAQDLIFNTTGTILEETFFTNLLRYAHYFKVRKGRSGLCLPSGCSKDEIQKIIDNVFQFERYRLNVDSCQTGDDILNYSLLQIIIAILIAMIVIVIVLATIIELYRKDDDSKLSFILKRLSIKHNLESLLHSKNGHQQDNLHSINGVRVLTMFWLVYGHAYLLSVKEAFRSSIRFVESLFDMKMYFLFNAWPAVDIFFLLSALLHSYHVFKILKHQRQINILRIISNRIARLWPSLWIIVAIVFIIPKIAQGPLWSEIMHQQVDSCYENWWLIITFMGNFRTKNNLCQVHTWYLSADVQLFLISFIFILLIYKYKKKALITMSIFNVLFCTFITVYFYMNRFRPTILFNEIDEMKIYQEMFEIYMPTYLHLTPYLVGIATGYLLVVHKENKTKFPKAFNFLWIFSILFVLTVIMSGYLFTKYPETPMIIQSIYAGFHRLAWALSIAFIIFFCEFNDTGLIKEFFSHKIFQPISKLCYLIYLIHFIITWTRYAYARQPLVFSHYTLFNEFIINSAYSFFWALIIYLFVEAPFSNIYSVYIGKRNWPIGNIKFNINTEENQEKQNGNIEMK